MTKSISVTMAVLSDGCAMEVAGNSGKTLTGNDPRPFDDLVSKIEPA